MTCPRHLHAQQIAAGRQIADRISLNQIVPVFIDQCLEWNEIQLTIRRDEELFSITQKSANRRHECLIQILRHSSHLSAQRIAKRLAELLNFELKLFGIAEVTSLG